MLLRALLLAVAIGALAPAAAVAQDRAGLQEIQRQIVSGEITPEQLRTRLEAAGLTLEDVRGLLREAGYPPELLDLYLEGGASAVGGTAFTPAQIEAVLRRLGVPALEPPALSEIPSGFDAADRLLADSTTVARLPGLPVFGRSLFERATSQFFPATAGPVPENYRLGPGDELVLILTGDVQEIYTLPITREGFIVIPNVGRVPVNGLTIDQLRNALYTYLGRVYSGVRRGPEATTLVEVSLSELRRNQIFVIGEVERPAQYEVTSVSTALDALYQAGGPTEHGSFRNIQIRRGERLVGNLDVYQYLTQGRAIGDIPLNQGDVVFVPVRGRRVEIDGNVVRPGVYELKGDEGLAALLDMAGGIEPEADLRRVQIDRVLSPEQREPGVNRSLFDVDLTEMLDGEGGGGGGEAIRLNAGDKIYVFAVSEELRNTVSIRGDVWSPGVYAYTPGMTLAEVVDRAGGLREDAYLGRAQIVRLDPLDLSRHVLPVTLPAGGGTALVEYDEIFVYSVADLQETRFVTIDGAVQNPGIYEFQENMTVRDLVLQAGGLLDGAYVAEAEVARLADELDRTGELAEIITVPLDSSYSVSGPNLNGGNSSNGNDAAAPEFELIRYDKVFIRRQPGWELQRTVVITGEVMFPGTYALQSKDEGLADLVRRAGGITADAYPGGVRFFRLEETAGGSEPDRARLNVDLARILSGRSPDADFLLAEGDSIDIPEFISTVQIEGAVLYATTVLFREGAGLDYYITSSGGYARDADKSRSRVEYANGSVKTANSFLFFKSKPTPGPGSRVFVPAKEPGKPLSVQSFAAIMSAVATIVILATR